MAHSAQPSLGSHEQEIEYQPVQGWSVIGLLVSLAAPLALVGSALVIVPIVGALANLIALWRVRLEPQRPGKLAALIGLSLSLFFMTIPIARVVAARIMLPQQAAPMANAFFEYLKKGQPERALLLHLPADSRQPVDENLWLFYRGNNESKEELMKFVNQPLIRTILALGERAEIRPAGTNGVAVERNRALLDFYYTITFKDDAGKKKTILMSLLMERKPAQNPALDPWRIRDFSGPLDPSK